VPLTGTFFSPEKKQCSSSQNKNTVLLFVTKPTTKRLDYNNNGVTIAESREIRSLKTGSSYAIKF
jgi:hypothetical protein